MSYSLILLYFRAITYYLHVFLVVMGGIGRFVGLLLCVGFLGCNNGDPELDNKTLYYDADWVFPIGQLSYSFEDEIRQSLGESFDVSVNDEGILVFKYVWTSEYTLDAGDIFSFEPFSVDHTIDWEGGALPAGTDFDSDLPPKEEDFTYDAGDSEIDSLTYEQGTLSVISTSRIVTASTSTTINVPALTSPTSPSGFSLPIVNPSPGRVIETYDLAGHSLDLTRASDPNTFNTTFDVHITQATGQSIEADGGVDFILEFSEVEVLIAYGTFKSETIELEDKQIDFAKIEALDWISFTDPTLTFKVQSSFGIPIHLDMDGLAFLDDNEPHLFTGSPISEGIFINAATEVGAVANTEWAIDATNSNIVDVLSQPFMQIDIPLTVVTNPPGHPQIGEQNFFKEGQKLDFEVTFEIPCSIILKDLEYSQSIMTTALQGLSTLDFIPSATLRLAVRDMPPIDFLVDVSFKNGSTVLYTLQDRLVLYGSESSADDLPILEDIVLGKEAFTQLQLADRIDVALTGISAKNPAGESLPTVIRTGETISIWLSLLGEINTRAK